jgi:hypothetical protein
MCEVSNFKGCEVSKLDFLPFTHAKIQSFTDQGGSASLSEPVLHLSAAAIRNQKAVMPIGDDPGRLGSKGP